MVVRLPRVAATGQPLPGVGRAPAAPGVRVLGPAVAAPKLQLRLAAEAHGERGQAGLALAAVVVLPPTVLGGLTA